MDLPMFSGKMDANEVVEWIEALNNYLDYKEVPKNK